MTYIDIEIDKLTHSIENVVTGDSFPTEILPLSKPDLAHLTKKNGWKFDWKKEYLQSDRDVFKLTILWNPTITGFDKHCSKTGLFGNVSDRKCTI